MIYNIFGSADSIDCDVMDIWTVLVRIGSCDRFLYAFDYPITNEEAHAFFYSRMPDEYHPEWGASVSIEIYKTEFRSKASDELILAYKIG
jgi:hypothetical protein